MSRRIKEMETALLGGRGIALWNLLSRGTFILLTILGLMFAASYANAACGELSGSRSGSPIRFPMLGQAGEAGAPGFEGSIVGLWHVVYTANGGTFQESLDEWHSDGTEFENVWRAPEGGNICFGAWKLIGLRTVRLHHVGWLFNPSDSMGNAVGTFTLDEVNTVSPNGAMYNGTFTFKAYDGSGNFLAGSEVNGTIAATRITVE